MSTHLFEAVWPILDERAPFADRIAAAAEELPDLAQQAHLRIAGTPAWQAQPAVQVPGWHAHAPGWVLIARVPTVPVERGVWGGTSDLDRRAIVDELARRERIDRTLGRTA